jgi:uncharacterized membrane protein YdbT with pleckstrin-like domain
MGREQKRAWNATGNSSTIRSEHRMSYVEKVLQPGEDLKYQAAIHWIAYAHGVAWLLVAVIVRVLVPASWRSGFIVDAITIILVCGGAFFLARAWFSWWITEIAVTNRRVIYKRGFISRMTAEMQMDKIESVKVDQSILGRILDYGKVTVLGTGTGTESLGKIDEPIAAPLALRNHITGV